MLPLLITASTVAQPTLFELAQQFQDRYEAALASGKMEDACKSADEVLVLANADGMTSSAAIGTEATKSLALQVAYACGPQLTSEWLEVAKLNARAVRYLLAAWADAVRQGVEKERNPPHP